MTRAAALFLALAPLLLLPGPAALGEEPPAPPPPPAPAEPDDEEEEEAAAAAEEARARAAKAAEEAAHAERKVLRVKRRTLERAAAAKEEEVDRLREAGDAAGAERVETELRALYREIAALTARLSMPPAVKPPAARPPQPVDPEAGRARLRAATEGLPPLVVRLDARDEGPVVTAALDWLARHQAPTGYWDADGFHDRCVGTVCPGGGGPLFDVGATGLAVCAFLGTGETHRTPRHGPVVRNALKYLKAVQDPEGCFGPRTSNHFTYNHALGTLAMTEAFGMTQSPLFKSSAEAGVNFVLQCRNPYMAWRYGVRPGDNDTTVTGWMVMALRSAQQAGFEVEPAAFQGAITWLDKVTDPETGRAGYTARGNGPARPQDLIDRFPLERSESLTAVAILTRIFCGQKPDEPILRKGLDLIARVPPRWDEEGGTIDFYYWYFGMLATFEAGGDSWKAWKEPLREALFPRQRGEGDGCARGSWDPVDPWSLEGGRVYSTALGALMSEVYMRYERVERPK